MKNEYELVAHNRLTDVNIFLVNLSYRVPHFHNELELCLVLSGTVEFILHGVTHRFQKGDIILLNPRQAHEISAVQNWEHNQSRNCLVLSLQISYKYCQRFFPSMSYAEFDELHLNPFFPGDQLPLLQKLLTELSSCYFRQDPYYEFSCFSMINTLIETLLKKVPGHFLSEDEKKSMISRSERLSRITGYMEEHYMDRILLADLASLENLSLTYLSHFFKDNLGMSFQEYLSLLRLQQARQLVENTSMSITDISMTCGFSDCRYLNKVYLKEFGATPLEVRRNRTSTSKNPLTQDLVRTTGSSQTFYGDAESLLLLQQLSFTK